MSSTDSDSDSSADVSLTNISSTLAIVRQRKPEAIPVLSDGIIDPSVIMNYENAVEYCCTFAEIPAEKQVASIAWGLKHPLVRDWYVSNKPELDALDIDTWFARMRTQFLPAYWISDTRRELINARQGKTEKFSDYLCHCRYLNRLLRSAKAQLDDKYLRAHLQNGLNSSLSILCQSNGTNKIADLETWTREVIDTDNRRLLIEQQFDKKMDKMMKNMSIVNANKSSKSSSTSTIRASTTKTFKNLPPLTDSERKLLRDNDGCFKCRRPFAGHIARDCWIGFPSPSNYVRITANVVRKAQAAQSKLQSNTTTALLEDIETDEDNSDNPYGVAGMPSAMLYYGTDESESDSDEYVAPSHTPQFPWLCRIGSFCLD